MTAIRPCHALCALWALMGGCNRAPEGPGPAAEDLGPNARFADCISEATQTWEALGATEPPANQTVVTTYDGRGWMIELLQQSPDPALALLATWDRLPDGQYSHFTLDLENDGTLDTIETLTFDEDDLLSSWEIDSDGDGAIDELRTYTAEQGRLATLDQDFGADGTVEVRYVFFHDDFDRVTGMDGDEGLDGSIDWTARWTYHSNGEVLRYEENQGTDPFLDFIEESTFDEAGRQTRLVRSYPTGGGPDEQFLYTYEAGKGEPATAEWRTSIGGELVQFVTMTMSYDDAQRLVLRESQYAPGEAPVDLVLTEEVTWDCGG